MRWRQVAGLYVVLGGLALWYWGVEREGLRQPEAPPGRWRFVSFDPSTAREVRVTRAGRRVVARREAGPWAVVEPPGAAVPSDLLAAFTEALATAEVIQRVPMTGTNPAAFGLGEAAARVEIVGAGGRPIIIILLGGPNPNGTALYAQRSGDGEAVVIGRNVGYYHDLIFQSLTVPSVPAGDAGRPVGG